MPPSKKAISMRFNDDLLDILKTQRRSYQTRINAVQHSYMKATQSVRLDHPAIGGRRYRECVHPL